MVSLFSMVLNAVISFLLYVLRAFFSMLAFVVKSLYKVFKLFFCAFPLTCIAFVCLLLFNAFLVFKGIPEIEAFTEYEDILEKDVATSVKLFRDLRIWWVLNIYPTRGTITFVLLIILSVIMAIPVLLAVLCIGVFLSFGQFLFYAACIDIVVYLLRAIFQKSFAAQFLDRYYRLFPDAGKRHYEKNYEKWLRKHHKDFEEDDEDYKPRKKSARDFYEDDEYDDDYDDEYYEDNEYYEEDEYGDEDYDEDNDDYDVDEYEDDEIYEDDEYYEDDYDDEEDDTIEDKASAATTFDFFAGCSSRESVDKKYKSLVKLYHPDNMDGDTAALQEINVQYTEAKKRFG
ncbi:MAG: hypothetical protein IJI01_12800 [Butyrivibrio sp.]|uniref:hypothetical protein n=1 Tax=Butyrivibrio sp. TaxID=28121 RepID=UPI0025BAC051|nr:hypothetical protein [Butyrivibrio sp.]MBQ6589540.1 hypothetical protein [Butyrivibrio sp.]